MRSTLSFLMLAFIGANSCSSRRKAVFGRLALAQASMELEFTSIYKVTDIETGTRVKTHFLQDVEGRQQPRKSAFTIDATIQDINMENGNYTIKFQLPGFSAKIIQDVKKHWVTGLYLPSRDCHTQMQQMRKFLSMRKDHPIYVFQKKPRGGNVDLMCRIKYIKAGKKKIQTGIVMEQVTGQQYRVVNYNEVVRQDKTRFEISHTDFVLTMKILEVDYQPLDGRDVCCYTGDNVRAFREVGQNTCEFDGVIKHCHIDGTGYIRNYEIVDCEDGTEHHISHTNVISIYLDEISIKQRRISEGLQRHNMVLQNGTRVASHYYIQGGATSEDMMKGNVLRYYKAIESYHIRFDDESVRMVSRKFVVAIGSREESIEYSEQMDSESLEKQGEPSIEEASEVFDEFEPFDESGSFDQSQHSQDGEASVSESEEFDESQPGAAGNTLFID